jgi:hypothetical protein
VAANGVLQKVRVLFSQTAWRREIEINTYSNNSKQFQRYSHNFKERKIVIWCEKNWEDIVCLPNLTKNRQRRKKKTGAGLKAAAAASISKLDIWNTGQRVMAIKLR